MAKRVKFKVDKIVRSKDKNILGDVISEYAAYYIYRPLLFGLIKSYLNFYGSCTDGQMKVQYTLESLLATNMRSMEAAEERIKDMLEHPNNYIVSK